MRKLGSQEVRGVRRRPSASRLFAEFTVSVGKGVGMTTLVLAAAFILACAPGAISPGDTGGVVTEGDWKARWEQTLASAKREGKVTVVTHTNLYYREMIGKFQEQYPEITVEHVAIRPSEFAPKVITEQQNGIFGYDVWTSSTSNMVELVVPAGGFEKITPYLILPEVTDPKNWRGDALLYATKEPYILLNRARATGEVWVNRDLVSRSEFNSMDHLIDPKFRAKIMIRTPNAPHGGSLTQTGILKNKGEDFIWKLMSDQQPVYIENARLATQNLINGKYPILLGEDGATVDQCIQAGGCKNLERVRQYRHILGHGLGVLQKAPHPNAAAVFANWFFTKEGQEAFKAGIIATITPADEAHSIRRDVEPSPDAVSSGDVPDYNNLSQYSLQGMEQGAEDMQKVLEIYRKIEAGGRR